MDADLGEDTVREIRKYYVPDSPGKNASNGLPRTHSETLFRGLVVFRRGETIPRTLLYNWTQPVSRARFTAPSRRSDSLSGY